MDETIKVSLLLHEKPYDTLLKNNYVYYPLYVSERFATLNGNNILSNHEKQNRETIT